MNGRELWACALAVERHYGKRGPVHIAERIGDLALKGDAEGVATWKQIAELYDQLATRLPLS